MRKAPYQCTELIIGTNWPGKLFNPDGGIKEFNPKSEAQKTKQIPITKIQMTKIPTLSYSINVVQDGELTEPLQMLLF